MSKGLDLRLLEEVADLEARGDRSVDTQPSSWHFGHNRPPNPGVAFGQRRSHRPKNNLPNAAPQPPRLTKGSVGAIVLNFKSITTRRINQLRKMSGVPLWQRDYYDRIIRDEEALLFIRQYIQNNPLAWSKTHYIPTTHRMGNRIEVLAFHIARR
ncbi:transposase [Oscillatoria sp. FACHB-1407]|uniref:transposase n=1 Tax=Oscillatoria sp. FACHB-1407 TaxID=2692847 RepID=UPI001686C554|nr:transposase [Oscillatoria sp. FACHB-1407]MBD2461869.1 transposase [Oscillatoria sp. FACHB-1407]